MTLRPPSGSVGYSPTGQAPAPYYRCQLNPFLEVHCVRWRPAPRLRARSQTGLGTKGPAGTSTPGGMGGAHPTSAPSSCESGQRSRPRRDSASGPVLPPPVRAQGRRRPRRITVAKRPDGVPAAEEGGPPAQGASAAPSGLRRGRFSTEAGVPFPHDDSSRAGARCPRCHVASATESDWGGGSPVHCRTRGCHGERGSPPVWATGT